MTDQTAKPNGLDLINQVVNFYRQYLDCSSEQLDLLALWTMHTHIIPAAPFSPALNICSRKKQSGKTLCLQLLSLLCDQPWMHPPWCPRSCSINSRTATNPSTALSCSTTAMPPSVNRA